MSRLSVAFGKGDRAPLLVSSTLWSPGWTISAQTGQAAVCPHPFTHLLSGAATFSLVGRGGGFQTLEDTSLRCVVNGTLVWMMRIGSPNVMVRPTNREIGSVFAGQTDEPQGEAQGKT